jgi:multiple sugar transport system substrate-binding protein
VVRAFGGDVLDKDWKRLVLDQAAGANAVQWMADLMVKQKVSPPFTSLSGPGDRAPFIQGKTALAPDIFPFIGTVHDGSKGAVEFDVAPLPKGPSGRINRNVAGTYILIKNGRNGLVGWEFMKYLASKEAQLLLAASGTVFPSLREAARSPEVLNPPAPAAQVNRRVFVEALENDKQVPEPALPVWDEITSLIGKELVPVWNGEKDARTVLQSLKGAVDAILSR